MEGENFRKILKCWKSRQLPFKVDSLFDFLFFGSLLCEQRRGKWSVQKNFTTLKEPLRDIYTEKINRIYSASFYSSRRKIYFAERREGSARRNFVTLKKKKKLGYSNPLQYWSRTYYILPSSSINNNHQTILKKKKKRRGGGRRRKKKEEKSRR